MSTELAFDLVDPIEIARRGAPVAIQVWGRPEYCDLTAMKHAIASVSPAAPAQPGLWEPGVLEGMAAAAGLTPGAAFDITWAYAFPDEDALASAMLSPGLIVELMNAVPEETVRAAIVDGLNPYRAPDGGYRLENEWHTLIASA